MITFRSPGVSGVIRRQERFSPVCVPQEDVSHQGLGERGTEALSLIAPDTPRLRSVIAEKQASLSQAPVVSNEA